MNIKGIWHISTVFFFITFISSSSALSMLRKNVEENSNVATSFRSQNTHKKKEYMNRPWQTQIKGSHILLPTHPVSLKPWRNTDFPQFSHNPKDVEVALNLRTTVSTSTASLPPVTLEAPKWDLDELCIQIHAAVKSSTHDSLPVAHSTWRTLLERHLSPNVDSTSPV